MQLVNELTKPAKMIVGVLTGNGKKEFKILRATVNKYNGSGKALYFPMRPGFPPGSGFSALKVMKIYVSKYKITSFLYLIDREHFTKNVKEEIEEKLRGIGIDPGNVQDFSVNGENVLDVRGTVGSHDFVLWVAVIGSEKCIEENIAKLISIKLEKNVEPTKTDVTRILREQGTNVEQFVASADVEQIKASFPALDLVLGKIEHYNNA